ncbi:MAG: hypothetical protein JWO09_2413 [Bacteroidetes bacterium]|nr:hypothetical protein [Bacteroidota bacterium]
MEEAKNKNARINSILLLSVLSLLFVYVVYRAYHMAITLDEGYSYGIIHGNKITAATANNHYLNTFLMAVCSTLFGDSELSLRLPSICGFLMYAYACYMLLRNKHLLILLSGIALLLLNPYLLDYFSLARGYALGIGFFMLSLVQLLKAADASTTTVFFKHAAFTLLFSTGACLANLTYVNANLILLLILFISYLRLKKEPAGNRKKIILFVSAVIINFGCLGILIKELFRLRAANELYFGGTTGFIHDTLHELVGSSMYFWLHNYDGAVLQIASQAFIALFLVIIAYVLFCRRYNNLAVLTILLSLMIAAPVVQFMLLATKLPFGRTSLAYIPLMGLCLCFFMQELLEKNRKKIIGYTVGSFSFLFLFIPGTFNFVLNANVSYCYDANFNMYSKEAMGTINELCKGRPRVTIMYSGYMGSGVNYYKHRYSINNLVLAGDYKPMADEDILLLLKNEKEQAKCLDGYTLLKQYPIPNFDCFLYVKKEQANNREELCRGDINLKASNRMYVCREWDQRIISNKKRATSWETFSFIAYPGNVCALKTDEGLYVSADLGSRAELTGNRTQPNEWELFRYIDLGGGSYAFKAANSKYLSLDTTTLQLYAKGDSIGANERFELIHLPILYDTDVVLKAFLQHSPVK